MVKKTKIQIIKRCIKIIIALGILCVLGILGFFVKRTYAYENANMPKWMTLSEIQRVAILNRVVPGFDENSQELLIQCVTKIAQLPDSDKMSIRDSIVICYNGIKTNAGNHEK